ncbi:MAG: type II toxin-antitoxin system VapC family toxin [Leptolyngbyaceae cyanobacterium SU_3_3]|nr:type II toxin-antitoxin system VapC family toxin [Leptolyngbyaceae cyanobacterium SU_3_3]NJR53001.1 type II toxin-antitoxin system VapC family toxin [Leptolyngbyaceae cyanobacterium CSU_1_3]
MKLLLDTHIWLWYALGDSQLSENLQSEIASNTTELWLSPISIWEVLLIVEKGRISLQVDTTNWINKSLKSFAIREALLNHQIAILSRQIDLPHQDPADRFIAATAIHYQLQLATVDTRLVAATWLPTVS